MMKQDTRQRLLMKGAEVLHRKGFNDAGIQEVLEAAGVPKGSFYYYFRSKEDFGLQVIDIYAGVMLGTLKASLAKTDLPMTERLKGFFRAMTAYAVEGYVGCPLGNLSLEMGHASEVFREKLDGIFAALERDMAEGLREAQRNGEIGAGIDAGETAVFLVSSWEGALLRMKLSHDEAPYRAFEDYAFATLLR